MGALPSFYLEQSKQEQENYHQYLRLMGSLSRLFSDSPVPYLAPKVMENIFCKAFNAENLALSNISYDALKDGLGIGLKTFLHQKGSTEQKVAEFNKLAPDWRNNIDPKENPMAFVEKIAEARNRRIDSTQALKKASNHLYHCITRTPDKIHLFETPLAKIDMDAVKTIRYTASSLLFSDDSFSYNFNFSKSVLLKRFVFEEQKALISIPIQIIEDPLDYLLLRMKDSSLEEKHTQNCKVAGLNYVYLPLYSEKEGKVPLKSGLNQWNASGRPRHEDELYEVTE